MGQPKRSMEGPGVTVRHRKSVAAVLARSGLFADVPGEELEELAAHAEILGYAPGETVLRRGEAGAHLYEV